MKQVMRRGLQNIGILALTLSLCLLAGEAFFRITMSDSIVLFPRFHAAANVGDFTIRNHRPNSVFWHTSIDGRWRFVTNKQGFRNDRDFSEQKPEGVIRIISLGDSHTEGFEVRQDRTFSAVVERNLLEQGIQAEAYNMGISGYGTAEAMVLLQNEAIKYRPDVVVLGFYRNDFEDNLKSGLYAIENGELVNKSKRYVPGVGILNIIDHVGAMRWLSQNSYLYSYAMNTVWFAAKKIWLGRQEARLLTEYAIPVEELDAYRIDLAGRLIEKIYEICKANGIKLLILDIPLREGMQDFASSVPQEMLDVMRANSDAFLYSEEILGRYRHQAQFHTPHGHQHISEFTHERFAERIAEFIRENYQEQSLTADSLLEPLAKTYE